jgi:hypothetical protein
MANHHGGSISTWEFKPIYFQRSLTAKFKFIFDILVVRETDSPSVFSGLRYFSTLDS